LYYNGNFYLSSVKAKPLTVCKEKKLKLSPHSTKVIFNTC
jgi:hypothetical protein